MDTASTDLLTNLGLTEEYFFQRGMQRYEEATELAVAQVDETGRVHELTPVTCEAWQQMNEAAAAAGHDIFIVSAFRSIARQEEIVRNKHDKGVGNDEIFAVSAPPGFSEHHTGRAIDISTPGFPALEEEFEQSEAFAWLLENAASFGFIMSYPRDNSQGYLYEPWHWCYQPNRTDA